MAGRRANPGSAGRPEAASAVELQTRGVPATTRLFLFVKAGGRCEFDGCNAHLLEHHVTKADGNFAEMAHVVAFRGGGPRGADDRRPADIHDVSNLMLLCQRCHKLIDDRPDEFPVDVMRAHKKAHEDRVFLLTDTKPDRETVAVVLRGRVAGKPVTITLPEIQVAVAPRYVGPRGVHDIDLTAIDDTASGEYWKIGAAAIRSKMARFYETSFDVGVPRHLSVFALAPIPLLMVLGTTLSDKVPTALFQRHRDTQGWKWKTGGGERIAFGTSTIRNGSDSTKVAVMFSLSGVIHERDLPTHIDGKHTVYCLAPTNAKPDRNIFDLEESFQSFRGEYQRLMRMLVEMHPHAAAIDIFPAVPAPAAVAMGRDLLPKRDPVLVVYDFNKAHGGFAPTLEINRHDRE